MKVSRCLGPARQRPARDGVDICGHRTQARLFLGIPLLADGNGREDALRKSRGLSN